MRIGKKGVSFLLCLSLVMSMGTAGVLSASAESSHTATAEAGVGMIDVFEENAWFSMDGGVFTVKKAGTYAFFGLNAGGDAGATTMTWTDMLDESTVYTSGISYDEIAESCWHSYEAGDKISEFTSEFFRSAPTMNMLYIEDGSTEVQEFALEVSPISDDGRFGDTNPMFEVRILEQSATGVVFGINVNDDLDSIGTLEVYRDGGFVNTYSGVSGNAYEIEVYSNGRYEFYGAADGEAFSAWATVSCIDPTVGGEVPEEHPDALRLSYRLSTDATGLLSSDSLDIIVSATYACTISSDGFAPQFNTSEASYTVTENGVYTFDAVDEDTGRSDSITVTVTSFGDGSMPSYDEPGDDENDNPLADGDHDDFWDEIGGYDEDGNPIRPGGIIDDENSRNPSDNMTALPQTGLLSWVAGIGISILTMGVGLILLYRKGILKKLFKKGGAE